MGALDAARRVHAVVDAIIVGTQPDDMLRRIVTATGGECYQIHDTTQGFELLEAESVVSIAARGGPRPVDATLDLHVVQARTLSGAEVAKTQRAKVNVGKVVDLHNLPKAKSSVNACLKRVN